jgi:glycosyltransferase involved in cell wall biosynthesis
MKVLYLTYDGLTDNLGQSQILPYVFYLQSHGHTMHIVSCEKPNAFNDRYTTIQSMLVANKVKHSPLFYTKRPPVLSTVVDVFKLIYIAKKLHSQQAFDVIHCRSYITALVGLYMKRNYGTKFVFDMRGFWADERVDGAIWNLKNPLYKLVYYYFKRKEKQFVQESDAIVSLTHAGLQEMETWNYVPNIASKTSIIPCCADFEHFKPMPYNAQLAEELNILPHHKVMCYLGSIGTWYLLDEMLGFYNALTKVNPNFIFLLLTPESPTIVHNACIINGVDTTNIRVTKANRADIPKYLSLVDIGISFIKPAYSKLSSSPTKMAEMHACGIPIVFNAGVGDVATLHTQYPLGLMVNDFTSSSYNIAVQQLESLLLVPKQQVRSKAESMLSLTIAGEAYVRVYNEL